jgi:hypothetical protein
LSYLSFFLLDLITVFFLLPLPLPLLPLLLLLFLVLVYSAFSAGGSLPV